jgi:putative hydrolase of the HAD superfamily
MLEYIFFDLYGTLVDIETDELSTETAEGFARWMGERYGPEMAERERHTPLAREFRNIVPPERPFGEPDIGRVIASHLQVLSKRRPTLRDVAAAAEAFRRCSRRRLSIIPGAREALDGLSKRFGIGLISNAQELFTNPELSELDLKHRFDSVVISSVAGVKKPSPEIFALALAKAGVGAAEALHVGNDPLDDVEGAAKARMRTCLVGRSSPLPGQAEPDLRLASVADLPSALLGSRTPAWVKCASA